MCRLVFRRSALLVNFPYGKISPDSNVLDYYHMEKFDKAISGMTKNYIKLTFQKLVIQFTLQENRYR